LSNEIAEDVLYQSFTHLRLRSSATRLVLVYLRECLFIAGVLVAIFESLHDGDVISDDAFFAWEECKEVAESEGKGVAVSSTIKFFTMLREIQSESDEDNADAD